MTAPIAADFPAETAYRRALDAMQVRVDDARAARDEARASIRDLGRVITSILDQRDEATTEVEQLREENAGLRCRIDELEAPADALVSEPCV